MKSSILFQPCKVASPLDQTAIKFYKTFSSKLALLLFEMFNHSLDQGAMPQTLTEANITLLLQPG